MTYFTIELVQTINKINFNILKNKYMFKQSNPVMLEELFWIKKNKLISIRWIVSWQFAYRHDYNNGNFSEWSAIWTEIKRVIRKSHDREAGVRFVITSLISVKNCTTRSSISTLLYSFWNHKYFCKPETFLFAKDTPPLPPWVL
jgi:hypothetical protein